MSKLVIGLAAFVLLAAGGALAGGALNDSSSDNPANTGATTDVQRSGPTGATTRAETRPDVRGPCDEAEHANDPRCAGGAVVGPDDDDRAEDADDRREDRADDDRADDDGRGEDGDRHGGHRSGPNSGHDANDDRSGPNRGRGDDD